MKKNPVIQTTKENPEKSLFMGQALTLMKHFSYSPISKSA